MEACRTNKDGGWTAASYVDDLVIYPRPTRPDPGLPSALPLRVDTQEEAAKAQQETYVSLGNSSTLPE